MNFLSFQIVGQTFPGWAGRFAIKSKAKELRFNRKAEALPYSNIIYFKNFQSEK